MIRFLIILSLAALVLSGLVQGFFAQPPSLFYEILGVLFLGTVGVHYLTMKIKKNRLKHFAALYTAIPLVKLVAYGIYALFIIRLDTDQAGANMITFISIYLIFTTLELWFSYCGGGE